MENQQTSLINSPDYKRSRKAYTMECAFEYFVALLVSDAYLSSLLSHMGISHGTIGIISSLISLAFLFQLFSIYAVKKIVNVKRAAIIFHFASQFLFISLFMVPFLPFATKYKTVIVIFCTLAAYFGNYLVTSVIFKWGMSFVDTRKRASFSATKEMISLILGMIFTVTVGYFVDRFAEAGDPKGGFIFIACAMLGSSLLDLSCLLLMKKPAAPPPETQSEPIRLVLRKLSKNKSFICLCMIGMLMYTSTYMTSGFLGIYKTSDLAFTVGEVQIINTVGVLFRFAISKPLGRFSDKTSHATGLLVGVTMLSVSFLLNVFCAPSTRWMIYLYSLLNNGAMAATGQNFLNITFDYVDNRYFVQATSIKSALSGVCGFGASLVGAQILSYVQANGNSFLGIALRGQQLLSAISFVLTVLLLIFILLNPYLKKQKN